MTSLPTSEWNRGTQSRPAFAQTTASVLLDTLRGIAALLVLLGHGRAFFFVDYKQISSHQKAWFLPYAFTSVGHAAVMVFFVLSGYLVGGHVLRSIRNNQWKWSRYLLQRSVRLYIVLVPALLLCLALDSLALHLHLAPALYSGHIDNHVTHDVQSHLGLTAFLGNLAFLQTRFVPVFGSDGPLWSLMAEFWFYLLFPLIMLSLLGKRRIAARLAMVALVVAIFACALAAPSGFAIWLMGAALAVLPARDTPVWVRWMAVILFTPILVGLSHITLIDDAFTDIVLGLATTVMIWVLLGARQAAPRAGWVHASRSLAGFSYTLYLVHAPMLMFVSGWLYQGERHDPTAYYVLVTAGIVVAVLIMSYCIAWLTEFRTMQLRKWLERKLYSVAL